MNYLGVYHSNYPRSTAGICDAPCVSKGKMLLCAADVATEDSLLAMLYGRIRNRRELIRMLECDPAIGNAGLLLKAYRSWGAGYIDRIKGPNVTCIMDTSEDILLLTRDRMGEQPLFYTVGGEGRVVFSDHPDSILKTASAEPVVSREGLCELFGLGPARTPGRTPLRDISSLEPGCMLIGEKGHVRVRNYFRIRITKHREDEEETIRHTRMLLEASVEPYISLKPGALLSGGLDSTALTALLCRRTDVVKTFSVDYRDNESDFRPDAFRPSMDSPYVEMAVRALGTRHHTTVLESAALAEALEAAVSARGFPGMADVDASLLLFAKSIAGRSRIVVSGECGDEVFAGYPWFRGDVPFRYDAFPWSGSVELRESVLRPEKRKILNLGEYVRCAVTDAAARTGVDGDMNDPDIRLKRLQLICFGTFMANLQERAVRMCGQYGLEVLTPLCDERLAEYVLNVPGSIKFCGGMEKGLFRAAVKDLIPEELLYRKKSPYPKTCSPIYTEIVRGLIMSMLADKDAPILEWIDPDRVCRLAESPMDPASSPWFGQLMAGPQMLAYLWQVNTWMRERNVTVSL